MIIPTKQDSWRMPNGTNAYFNAFGVSTSKVLLIVHGFKSFKDWGFFPYVGEYYAKQGFYVLCFNFSGNGTIGHSSDFTNFEAFEHNTFSKEKEELLTWMRLCVSNLKAEEIYVLGHSRGGGISILAGAEAITEGLPIRKVITWSSINTVLRFDMETWAKQGYLEINNTRTQQVFRLGKALYEDIITHHQTTLNIKQAAKTLTQAGAFLGLVHGQTDETVSDQESTQLYDATEHKNSALHLIPNAGHTFNAQHPFVITTPELQKALEITSEMLK